MIPVLVAIPIFSVLIILQSAVVSSMPLLKGTADLILLAILAWALQERVRTVWHWSVIGGFLVSIVSELPFGVLIAAYLLSTVIALLLKRQIWKSPFLAMLAAVFLGTVIVHAFSLAGRWFTGTSIPVVTAFNLITLPSILLNLLLAIPFYAMIRDLANWLYPEEIKV